MSILENSQRGLREHFEQRDLNDYRQKKFFDDIVGPFIAKYGDHAVFENPLDSDELCQDVEFYRHESLGIEIMAGNGLTFEEAQAQYRDAILEDMFKDLVQLVEFEERFGRKVRIYSFHLKGVNVNPDNFEPYAMFNVKYRTEKLEY